MRSAMISFVAAVLAFILLSLARTDSSLDMLEWLVVTFMLMPVLWLVSALIRVWQETE